MNNKDWIDHTVLDDKRVRFFLDFVATEPPETVIPVRVRSMTMENGILKIVVTRAER